MTYIYYTFLAIFLLNLNEGGNFAKKNSLIFFNYWQFVGARTHHKGLRRLNPCQF